MNGYPVGTKCVITRMSMNPSTYGAMAGLRLGEVVLITGRPWLDSSSGCVQDTSHRGVRSRYLAHPVNWMRPIDGDITNDDLEVVAQYHKPILLTERA